jgi:hypothetical protein
MKPFKVHRARCKVQGLKSKVQSSPGTGRGFFDFGHGTLGFRLRPSNFGDREGVALVITLIMLAIITFMAVTFLVLSNRERSSVSTAMDQKIARNASDAGLARVSAELLTRIMLQTNFQNFDLMVSTNYINYRGLHSGSPGNLSPTNVNYDYLDDGKYTPITDPQDREIAIASLLYNPRPPVYPVTNAGTGETEFRYYFDLNRNGRYDKNGNWPVVVNGPLGGFTRFIGTNTSGVTTYMPPVFPTPKDIWVFSNSFVGDPEWIGNLERPQEMHSADNRFVSRYAYIVIPVGKTLDMNYIHDHAKKTSALQDGFMRNQGVGTWEINLAGFLADLNTNAWWNTVGGFPGYAYNQNTGVASTGSAFTNANDILNYRYGPPGYSASLAPANALFPSAAVPALASDNIDEYSDGPMMLTTSTNEGSPVDAVGTPWAGSENSNHFFATQDIFSKMPPGFRAELSNLGTSNDSYNAYTFYRMLAQLGTDTAVETNKLNINYKNTDIHGNIVPGMETNLISWTAEDFFTNATDRILAQMTNNMGVALSSAYIPIYPTNYYTPAVHRALQLAANIFDATTNQTVPLLSGETNAFFPSVFRPVFTSEGGKVWISGYREVVDLTPLTSYPWWDMNTVSNNPGTWAGINVYGVPWVIGAKKDLPNFNEYAMETAVSFGRKLMLTKTKKVDGSTAVTDVKQLFEVGVSNSMGIEAWNSYPYSYPRNVRIFATNEIGISITNQDGINLIPSTWKNNFIFPSFTNIAANTWSPFISQTQPNNSIVVPLQSSDVFFTNAAYVFNPPRFQANDPASFTLEANVPMPELFLTTTNRVQFFMTSAGRVIDFVNLERISTLNISQAARNSTKCGDPAVDHYTYWCTNLLANQPYTPDIPLNEGINYQLGVSMGVPLLSSSEWRAVGADPNNMSQVKSFNEFLMNNPGNTNLVMQTPFNPAAFIYQHTSWQANDPLVHYMIGDLIDPGKDIVDNTETHPPLDNIGKLNTRYRPWGGYRQNQDNNTDYNPALKDPGLTDSSVWDFPTNKFPGIGWLGRVHRGSAWQTVYMKSPIVNLNDWKTWTGNSVVQPNGNQDAGLTTPVNDYALFDLFTTSINDNAARGQLNINQTNLAAWSAVLSGVNVLTNSLTGVVGPAVIAPAGVYDTNNPTAVARIWMGINAARANNNTNFLIFKHHAFQHLGDVLAAPELTIGSPFLNTNNPVPGGKRNRMTGINDEVMERIPQQIMSLLTLNQTPRFVIYSFGQTLHPADHSLVTGGTFNGLCTNYQVTAESAVRAVVRVEGTPDPKFVGGRVDSQGRSYPPHLVVEQFNVLGPD